MANAAFVLRRKLSAPTTRLLLGSALAQPSSPPSASLRALPSGVEVRPAHGGRASAHDGDDALSAYLSEGLLVRQLAMSANKGNAESAQLLGNHFLHSSRSSMFGNRRGAEDSTDTEEQCDGDANTASGWSEDSTSTLEGRSSGDCVSQMQQRGADSNTKALSRAALWWFTRSSAMGSPMGSLQAGLMHHFGIGTPGGEVNTHRAVRLYRSALEYGVPPPGGEGKVGEVDKKQTVVTDPMPATVQVVTRGLLWLASRDESNVLAQGANGLLAWIAQTLFEDDKIKLL